MYTKLFRSGSRNDNHEIMRTVNRRWNSRDGDVQNQMKVDGVKRCSARPALETVWDRGPVCLTFAWPVRAVARDCGDRSKYRNENQQSCSPCY
eukprot:gene3674-biopygen12162